jgi:hypothetical protein
MPFPLLLSLLIGQAAPVTEPIVEPILPEVPCDYGENQPRLPRPASSRAELYDLLLGQVLRPPQRRAVLAALSARFPGDATDAFIAIQGATPYDSDASIRTLEGVVARYRASSDPEVQIEVARARRTLILGWRSRHVGAGRDGHHLFVAETYRASAAGRRWSAMLDQFLRDYRGRGPAFDEFVASTEYDAIGRDAADRTPGEHVMDPRLLEPSVIAIGEAMRVRMRALIDRYGAHSNERVQRIVLDAIDAFAPYGRGRAAMIQHERAIIARYRDARDYGLRSAVNGAYERLKFNLEETGDAEGLAAVTREHRAWTAAHYDVDCGPQ